MVRTRKLLLVGGLLGLGWAGGLLFRKPDVPLAVPIAEAAPQRWSEAEESRWEAELSRRNAGVGDVGGASYLSAEATSQPPVRSPSAKVEKPANAPLFTLRPPTNPPERFESAAPPPIPERSVAPPWTADPAMFERRAELTRYSPTARLDEPVGGRVRADGLRPLREGDDDPAPPLRQPETKHRVRDGDTLETLAAEYLGDRGRAGEIFQENRHLLSDPQLLPIGTLLTIPAARPPQEGRDTGVPAARPAGSKLVPLPPRPKRTAGQAPGTIRE